MNFEITPEMQAPKSLRILNFFIDLFAYYAIIILLMFFIGLVGLIASGGDAFFFQTENFWISLLFWNSLYFGYYFVWEAAAGRTLGKLITGTIVVHESGDKATARTILIRTLCRFIPFEALSFLGDSGWHDSLSGTAVVKKHIYIQRKNEVIELDEIGDDSQIL